MEKLKRKPRKPIPPETELAKYLEEHTKQETCSYYRINDRTLNRWIIHHRLKEFYVKKPQLPPDRERLRNYLLNHTILEAIDKFKTNKTTMERWLKDLNLQAEFHFDHSTMISLAKAAKEVGVSRSMASLWFKNDLIPGARKVNATRVVVPKESVEQMKKLRKEVP